MADLVSILVPAYNAEKWIRDTIKSALGQTWPVKEIIIVDDGSTDNTLQIARGFESKLLRVITQDNMGAPAARNKALSFAQGDYIQWLDHDDLLAPDKISRQLKDNEYRNNTRILFSGAFGMFYYCHRRARFKPNPLWQDLTPLDYFLIKFTKNAWLHPTAWLVSRKLTDMAGSWYERRSPDDDGEYFCRVVAASGGIKFVPEARSYWRVGNFGSLSNTRSGEALEALFVAISRSINHLRLLEDSERTRAACLKYLQNRLLYFYPEKHEILEKAEKLAQDLGGHLLPPEVSWKLSLFKTIFGWKIAKKIKSMEWSAETYVRKNWDRLFFY
jgi:glycosyltransferase involved in cell wall biosynthesis